ncbi:MAG TPA: hypothetical protein VGE74_00930 [Gemmata sp.]
MKWLAVLAFLTAVGLLGWGVYEYRLETRPVGRLEVERPERDLGECPIGKSQVVFRVTNGTDREAEVLGVPEACGPVCCLKATTAERLRIPPGGSADLVLDLLVGRPEPFEFSGNLYLNDNGFRTLKLTVRGTGVAPRAGDAPK